MNTFQTLGAGAFTTRPLMDRGHTEGDLAMREDTSSSYESDSDEAMIGRRKRPTLMARIGKDDIMDHILQTFKGEAKYNATKIISYTSLICASVAIIAGVLLPTDSVTNCRRSFTGLAAVILAVESILLVDTLRDGAVVSVPDGKGRVHAETHFLAGALPEEIAPLRVLAFSGFIVGVFGSLFGIWLMNAHILTKVYMILGSIYITSAALSFQITKRDFLESDVWRETWANMGRQRRVQSTKIENAVRNIATVETRSQQTLKALFFFILATAFILTGYTLFNVNGAKHGHKGLLLGGMVFSCGAGWFLGKVLNRNTLDEYLSKIGHLKDRSPVYTIGITVFLFVAAVALSVIGIVLMKNDLVHILIFVVGILCMIDATLNLSKVINKEANVRILIKELEKRMPGIALLNFSEYEQAPDTGGYDYQGGTAGDFAYPPHSAMVEDPAYDPGKPGY